MFRKPLPEPASEHHQFASDEEHSKNYFVVSGQPVWQVDVEIVGVIRGELLC